MAKNNYSVLIVEDELQSRNILKHFVEAYGYEPYTATTIQDAIDILKTPNLKINAVIVDLNLQDAVDGLDLISWIKKNVRKTSVIAESCYDDTEIIKKAIDSGANEYLTKPITSSRLHNVLVSLIEKRVAPVY